MASTEERGREEPFPPPSEEGPEPMPLPPATSCQPYGLKALYAWKGITSGLLQQTDITSPRPTARWTEVPRTTTALGMFQ